MIDEQVDGRWQRRIVPAAGDEPVVLASKDGAVFVRAVDRTGNLGEPGSVD